MRNSNELSKTNTKNKPWKTPGWQEVSHGISIELAFGLHGVSMELPWSLSMPTPCKLHTEAMQTS
jgi:hypothetical protein